MKLDTSRLDLAHLDTEVGGYAIFATADRPPDPDVDTPIAIEDATVAASEIDVVFPGSAARIHGLVVAVNDQSDGLPGAAFGFAFDGLGDIEASPAPVTNLKASPKAGGLVDVTWSYRDADLKQKAAAFQLTGTVGLDAGGSSTLASLLDSGQLTVSRDGLRPDYRQQIGPLPAGLLELSVLSATQLGSAVSDVQSVTVRVDPDAPSDITLGLQAT